MAGVAPLAVPDVFAGPELVAMIVADEVETVDGIPVYYGGDYDDSDYEDPRNEVETVDGIPVYYGGDNDDSDYEDPRNEAETVDGFPVYYGGDFNYSDCEDHRDIFLPSGWRVGGGGGGGTLRLVLCCDCLCLITLFRDILPYDLWRSCLPTLVLKDICCWWTIDRELDSSGRVIPPCHAPLSSCLDVSQIKILWTDAIVGRDINALLRLCVGVRGAAVGVVAPV